MTRKIEKSDFQFLPLPPVQKKVGQVGGESRAQARTGWPRTAVSQLPSVVMSKVTSHRLFSSTSFILM